MAARHQSTIKSNTAEWNDAKFLYIPVIERIANRAVTFSDGYVRAFALIRSKIDGSVNCAVATNWINDLFVVRCCSSRFNKHYDGLTCRKIMPS